MTQFLDLVNLLNIHNLIGNPLGTLTVPNLSVQQNANEDYVVSYSFFRTSNDIIDADYYNFPGGPSENIVSSADYRTDIETAIQSILNTSDTYSVLFSDVAKLDFEENLTDTGVITFSQLEGNTALFSSTAVSAVSLQYTPSVVNADKQHGDIFINLDHDSNPILPGFGFNMWNLANPVVEGTRPYKVLLEEISHALGVDIKDAGGIVRNEDINNHKFTVTSNIPHPDMQYSGTLLEPGLDVFGPFPTGLQLFDIAALQEIYGRNYSTRNENLDSDPNTTGTLYGRDLSGNGAFSSNVADGSFIYTIWDGGGNDIIDAGNFTGPVKIDLRQGEFSSIGTDGAGNNGFEFTVDARKFS